MGMLNAMPCAVPGKGDSGRPAVTAPGESRYCEVRFKRARDLTDQDVIKYQGQWREVFAVYRSEANVVAEFGQLDEHTPGAGKLIEQFRDAFDRILDTYVILRIWLHEKSADEDEDELVTVYRNELFEVQTLPAFLP